jgi:transcriptional regulator with XRE-family HTH domain
LKTRKPRNPSPTKPKPLLTQDHGQNKIDLKQLNKQVGQAIARQRTKANMTQAFVASELGIEPESVSRLETGVYSPSLERLAQFASLFGCPIQAFFREVEDLNDLVLTLADIIKPLNSKNQELTLIFISQLVSFIDKITDNRISTN